MLRLVDLHDKINTQLRAALKTLGVTFDEYASMLQPLVESCLNEDTIERNSNSEWENHKPSDKLSAFMRFMKSEFEGEERTTIIEGGLGVKTKQKFKKTSLHCDNRKQYYPSAMELFNISDTRRHKRNV